MDAWYRHFEKDCSHSLAIDYRRELSEFSRKERVRRGAFDMHSFFSGASPSRQWKSSLPSMRMNKTLLCMPTNTQTPQ